MKTVTLRDETDEFSCRYQTELMLHVGDTVKASFFNWKSGKTVIVDKAKIVGFDKPSEITMIATLTKAG